MTGASSLPGRQSAQIRLRKDKLRSATIHADQELGKNPDDGFVEIFQSGKMDSYFPVELFRVV